MTTIAKGNTLELYFDHTDDFVITPGSGGSVRFDCSTPNSAATRPAGRVIYSATTISIPAGSTVFAEAVGADATYTVDDGVISYATDPITGLDVLDAGSQGVVLGSGLDFGATPIAPLHTFDAFDSTAITTASQYYANIDAWAAALPQVTKTDLGVSSDGLAANHLYEYKTGTGPIKILIVCGAHGPELTTSWAAYMWFKALATSNSTLFSMLRSRLTVSWIPTGNPAQFRGTRQNANGVDLNRNYPFYWANYSTGTSGVGQENYKGASALSEAEPLAIKALIDSGGI
ncbi:MAG: hypothetical protein KA781_02730, partial [Aquabacterium sp.]|nr:hypothetical protein [Aquabacterium sp.]